MLRLQLAHCLIGLACMTIAIVHGADRFKLFSKDKHKDKSNADRAAQSAPKVPDFCKRAFISKVKASNTKPDGPDCKLEFSISFKCADPKGPMTNCLCNWDCKETVSVPSGETITSGKFRRKDLRGPWRYTMTCKPDAEPEITYEADDTDDCDEA